MLTFFDQFYPFIQWNMFSQEYCLRCIIPAFLTFLVYVVCKYKKVLNKNCKDNDITLNKMKLEHFIEFTLLNIVIHLFSYILYTKTFLDYIIDIFIAFDFALLLAYFILYYLFIRKDRNSTTRFNYLKSIFMAFYVYIVIFTVSTNAKFDIFVYIYNFSLYLIVFLFYSFCKIKDRECESTDKIYYGKNEKTSIDELLENRKIIITDIINDIKEKMESNFSIAIDGEWGSGKSSLVNVLRNELSKRVEHIKYEWIKIEVLEVDDKESIYDEFYSQLNEILKKYNYYTGLGSDFNQIFVNGLEVLSKKEFSKIPSLFNSKLSSSYLKDKNALNYILETLYENEKVKIIVVIDDIDRLHDDKLKEIFYYTKSLLNRNKLISIFLYDRSIIEKVGMNGYTRKFVDATYSVSGDLYSKFNACIDEMKIESIINEDSEDIYNKVSEEIKEIIVFVESLGGNEHVKTTGALIQSEMVYRFWDDKSAYIKENFGSMRIIKNMIMVCYNKYFEIKDTNEFKKIDENKSNKIYVLSCYSMFFIKSIVSETHINDTIFREIYYEHNRNINSKTLEDDINLFESYVFMKLVDVYFESIYPNPNIKDDLKQEAKLFIQICNELKR